MKHLANKDFCDEFQDEYQASIAGKAVLYMGAENEMKDGIRYVSAEEFLCRTQEALERMRDHYRPCRTGQPTFSWLTLPE